MVGGRLKISFISHIDSTVILRDTTFGPEIFKNVLNKHCRRDMTMLDWYSVSSGLP